MLGKQSDGCWRCFTWITYRHVTFGRETLQLVQEYEGNQPLSDFFWAYRWGGISDVLKTFSLHCYSWFVLKGHAEGSHLQHGCLSFRSWTAALAFSRKNRKIQFWTHFINTSPGSEAPNPGYVSCSQNSVVFFLHKLDKCNVIISFSKSFLCTHM